MRQFMCSLKDLNRFKSRELTIESQIKDYDLFIDAVKSTYFMYMGHNNYDARSRLALLKYSKEKNCLNCHIASHHLIWEFVQAWKEEKLQIQGLNLDLMKIFDKTTNDCII